MAILIDDEKSLRPVAIIENDDEVYEVGFTTLEESKKLEHYYKARVLHFHLFVQEVKAIRHKDNRLIEWLRQPTILPAPLASIAKIGN